MLYDRALKCVNHAAFESCPRPDDNKFRRKEIRKKIFDFFLSFVPFPNLGSAVFPSSLCGETRNHMFDDNVGWILYDNQRFVVVAAHVIHDFFSGETKKESSDPLIKINDSIRLWSFAWFVWQEKPCKQQFASIILTVFYLFTRLLAIRVWYSQVTANNVEMLTSH